MNELIVIQKLELQEIIKSAVSAAIQEELEKEKKVKEKMNICKFTLEVQRLES